MSIRRSVLASSLALGVACAPIPEKTTTPTEPHAGYASGKYAADSQWLCRPDLPSDRCKAGLTSTEIHSDGSLTLVPHVAAAAPKVDCFYVYPTVDLGALPGNHTDFTDIEPMAATAVAQAARLGEVCDVYAPLYRQITIGTYLFSSGAAREDRLVVAFSDVADAFAHYLGTYNRGRKIVLIGHSQGADMVVRLVERFFEKAPALRDRLLVAFPIGRPIEVPKGRLTGGTFATTPICTRPEETGCVVAFQSHRADKDASPPAAWLPKPGNETVCVNPANVGSPERATFSRTYLPARGRFKDWLKGVDGIKTPFVLVRNLYAGQCVDGRDGYRYLAISFAPGAGDKREGPVDLSAAFLNTSLGLHVFDAQFPQGDIIDLIARKAAAP